MAVAVLIDGFAIDVADVDHDYTNAITEHPIENGAVVSDHVRVVPPIVTIEGIVSDTPLFAVDGLRTIGSLPSDDAFTFLRSLHDSPRVVTLETPRDIFTQMMLRDFSAPENAQTGDALRFRAVFKQIELVTNIRTTVKVAIPRAKKKQERGNVPAKTVPVDGIKGRGHDTLLEEFSDKVLGWL